MTGQTVKGGQTLVRLAECRPTTLVPISKYCHFTNNIVDMTVLQVYAYTINATTQLITRRKLYRHTTAATIRAIYSI